MVKYVTECKALGIKYVYDPSQQIPLLSREELIDGISGAHILIVNDYEFGLIEERTGLTIDEIIAMIDALVITQGETGSSIYADNHKLHIPAASPINVADPTGAGDAYRAGLLAGRLHNLNWLEAGRLAALTAAYVLEECGTQKHTYTIDQFARRYFEHFDRTESIERFFNSVQKKVP
jgi:adenosine kinase